MKRDPATDRCSGCNEPKAKTCVARNRCSCEDGQDGTAHWVKAEDICPICKDARCKDEEHAEIPPATNHAPSGPGSLKPHSTDLCHMLGCREAAALKTVTFPALPINESDSKLIDQLVAKASKKHEKTLKKLAGEKPNISKKDIKPPLPKGGRHLTSVADLATPIEPTPLPLCQACKEPGCPGDCPQAKVAPLVKAREEKKAQEEKNEKDVKEAFEDLSKGENAEW